YSGTGVSANTFDPTAETQTVTYAYTDGNGCSATATTTITVNPNYNIVGLSGAHGSLLPNGTTAVCSGTNQLYSITADAGYHILDVLVDGVSDAGAITGGAYTFTNVTNTHSITAVFAPDCIAPVFTTCPGN